MYHDKIKAVLFCLMVLSSSFAEVSQAEDNTYYFNAEVTRYHQYDTDSWTYSSTLCIHKKKSSSERSSPMPQTRWIKYDLHR